MIGDSFVFGWGVNAEATATARLNAQGVNTLNLGMPGDGINEYRRRISWARETFHQPTAIVLCIYDNDLSSYVSQDATGTTAVFLPRLPATSLLKDRLLTFNAVRLAGRILDVLGLSDQLASVSGYDAVMESIVKQDWNIHTASFQESAQYQGFIVALDELLNQMKTFSPKVILLRITPVYSVGGEDTARWQTIIESDEEVEFQRMKSDLAALSASAGVDWINCAPSSAEQERSWYFPYDRHLTVEGHQALAEQISTALK